MGEVSRPEEVVTNVFGFLVVVVGLIGFFESLLQTAYIGDELPFLKGTLLSLFTVGFGTVLFSRGATKALKQLRES